MLFPDVCSRLTSVFSLILLTAAVGASQPVRAQSVAKKAVLEISAGTNYTLVLPRTVFGKEHLMSASRIPQSLAATSTGLSGKIVKFELFHDGVDLYGGLSLTLFLPLFLPRILHDEDGVVAKQTAPASDDRVGLIQRSCIG